MQFDRLSHILDFLTCCQRFAEVVIGCKRLALSHERGAHFSLFFQQLFLPAFLQDDLLGALQFNPELADLFLVVFHVVGEFLLALLRREESSPRVGQLVLSRLEQLAQACFALLCLFEH